MNQTNRQKFISKMVRDVKVNGLIFVKSAVVANELKAFDPTIQIEYNREDKTYYVSYSKKGITGKLKEKAI